MLFERTKFNLFRPTSDSPVGQPMSSFGPRVRLALQTLAMMRRAESRAIVVDDIGQGVEPWPCNIINAMNDDECKGHREEC